MLAGLLAAGPVAASSVSVAASASSLPATSTTDPALSTAKVVIIVGATEGATASYKADGDAIYNTAIQYSSHVVKVYSPNATWSAVQAAVAGASIVVYLGHGNGWPSPYTYDAKYTTKDGFGLNDPANLSDNVHKYYGEPYVSTLNFAPNAIVLLNHLCYASGNSEPGNPDPTLSVAEQRADNYAAGFLKGGAKAVIAEGHGSLSPMIAALFSSHESVYDAWQAMPSDHGNTFTFSSSRTSGATAAMDPDTSSGGYYRSFVGSPDVRTEDVTGVPFVPTDTTPDTLQAPGAASVAASGGITLYHDSSLTYSGGSLPEGTDVRVDQLTSGAAMVVGTTPPPAAYVSTMDGSKSGWTAADSLAPQDSLGPELWAADGPRAITPNGDGKSDSLAESVRFSEAVAWTADIRNASGHAVWSTAGNGDTTTLAWDMKVGGTVVPNGAYALDLHAEDGWGNTPLVTTIDLSVDSSILPTRLAGADRYATAVAISKATYMPGVPVAYVASGLGFADALAGAAAAGTAGGPLLTIPGTSLPAATAAELDRLNPAKIIVLGGTGSVSSAVVTQLASHTTGSVTRLAGADRYATAVAISKATYKPGVPVAYVASGLGFADALAGAAAAGTAGSAPDDPGDIAAGGDRRRARPAQPGQDHRPRRDRLGVVRRGHPAGEPHDRLRHPSRRRRPLRHGGRHQQGNVQAGRARRLRRLGPRLRRRPRRGRRRRDRRWSAPDDPGDIAAGGDRRRARPAQPGQDHRPRRDRLGDPGDAPRDEGLHGVLARRTRFGAGRGRRPSEQPHLTAPDHPVPPAT